MHFRGAFGLAKMASVSTLALLAITRSPENGYCIHNPRQSRDLFILSVQKSKSLA